MASLLVVLLLAGVGFAHEMAKHGMAGMSDMGMSCCKVCTPQSAAKAAGAATQPGALPGATCADAIFPNVTCFGVAANGDTVNLIFGQSKDRHASPMLYVARSEDHGQHWSAPVKLPVGKLTPSRLRRGRDPQIAVRGKHMMAVWNVHGQGPYGSGPIGVAISSDGGKHWRLGPSPSISGAPDDTGYRFPAVAVGPNAFHVVWVHAAGDSRSLRYAQLAFGADHWSPAAMVDATSCSCCWPRLEVLPNGSLVTLYRDEVPREMAVAVSRDHGRSWHTLDHPGDFNWQFNGCPENGGGLAISSNVAGGGAVTLATSWTGAPGKVGAYVFRSTDGGTHWSAPKALRADGHTGLHTDVAMRGQRAVVAWDESGADGRMQVYAMISNDGGVTWGKPQRLSGVNEYAVQPRAVACADGLLVFWTAATDGGRPGLCMKKLKG